MELEELKKSWNALDKHLEDKIHIDEGEIARLIQCTTQNVQEINRFNSRLRFLSIAMILAAIILLELFNFKIDNFFKIISVAIIPALSWDWFVSQYLAKTHIDELTISTVILRFNKIHRWILMERMVGMLFLLGMLLFTSFHFHIWHTSIWIITAFIMLCGSGISFAMWMYKKNLCHLHQIKKNLADLKELKK